MLMQVYRFLVGFIASEEGVKKQAILPVAWVAAVMMAAAVVLSMPEKAHAGYCWTAWDCDLDTTPAIDCGWWCGNKCYTYSSGCVPYGSSGRYRCRCGSP